MQTITVCTDAGHTNYYHESIASWATYIRTPSQTIRTSGIIGQQCKGSSQAEQRAIANALFIISKRYDLSKYKIILYLKMISFLFLALFEHPFVFMAVTSVVIILFLFLLGRLEKMIDAK